MPCRLTGQIPGVHESSISLATCRIAPLLEQHGITIAPARARISSLSALRRYAAAAGITSSEPQPHTPPQIARYRPATCWKLTLLRDAAIRVKYLRVK
jgi:hypothetical protein